MPGRFTRSRLRRCWISDGARSAPCARARGSTSPRRARNCTTLDRDPGETTNLESHDPQRASRLLARVEGYGGVSPLRLASAADAANRLRSLGYLGSGSARPTSAGRADPKDRIHVASRLAEVTSGEAAATACSATLEAILEDDPANPQAHLRLGYAEIERGRCDRAEPHLRTALAARLPSADAGLALADCRRRANDVAGAVRSARSRPGPGTRESGGRGQSGPDGACRQRHRRGDPMVAIGARDGSGLLGSAVCTRARAWPCRPARRCCGPGARASRAIASRCSPTPRSPTSPRGPP